MLTSMDLEQLRLTVYRCFAATGRAPGVDDLAERLDLADDDVRSGLHALAAARHVVLADDDSIVLAHPFSSVPMGFSVMSEDTLWWGGCAWDSFALPHLLADRIPTAASVLVATRCPACGRAHAWNVDRSAPPAGDQVAHFLVPAARIWDDVVHTCANQRIFCSGRCVDEWIERTGSARGYEMGLDTLWRLAERWYEGRLDAPYTRRDPATAAEYLRSVGLSGPFWFGS